MDSHNGLKDLIRDKQALLLMLLPSLFLISVVVVPFVMLADTFGAKNYAGLLFSNSFDARLAREAFVNSLEQGAVSAILSFCAGFPLGMFLGRYDFRYRRLLASLSILPFFLPSIVVVFAFILSFGPASPAAAIFPPLSALSRGFTGIVAVNVFFNAPLVVLTTMVAVMGYDPQLEEASKSLGAGRLKTFITTWGKEGIAYGAWGSLLSFIYSFSGFTAPLIIGGQRYFTLETWIYFLAKVLDQIGNATFISLVQVTFLFIPAIAYVYLFRSRMQNLYSSRQFHRADSGSRWFLAGALYAAIFLLAETYIFSAVIEASLNFGNGGLIRNFIMLFSPNVASSIGITTFGALLNSLFYGVITALSVTFLALSWIFSRRRLQTSFDPMDALQFMPLIISAIILALSLSAAFSPIVPADSVWVLIVMAQSVVSIPLVFRIVLAGFSNIPLRLREASVILGGNAFFEIEVPLAYSAVSTAMLFGFATSLGEFAATNFLTTPRFISLTVEIYSLQSVRLFHIADAAVAFLLLISIVLFTAIQGIGDGLAGIR